MNIVQQFEAEEVQKKEITAFSPGDTVVVQVKVKEGDRERLQAYEGVVISKKNRGLNSAFIVRKISHGEGVERTFQTYSPLIDSITVKRRGDVRRAKLYYLRELSGRAARIKEKLQRRGTKSTMKEAAAPKAKKATAAKAKETAAPTAKEAPAPKAKDAPTAEAPKAETPKDAKE